MTKPKIKLACNSVCTNDPCALCGRVCEPCGLDFILECDPPEQALVCGECACEHALELYKARAVALDYAKTEAARAREFYKNEVATALRSAGLQLCAVDQTPPPPGIDANDGLPF
jgi:hypothetical protein